MADSLEKEVVRGGHARAVLDSAVFKEAREHVERGILNQMAQVAIKDEVMHTRLITMLQLWRALERYLETIAETGQMADFQIEKQREKRRLFG